MKKKYPIIFIILALFTYFQNHHANSAWKKYEYKVVKVIDGDTIIASDGNVKFKVRIAGMDTPERGQPLAKSSTYHLKKLILDKSIQIKPIGRKIDRYSRVLGQIYLDEEDVSLIMIQRGLAYYYRPKCRDYPHYKDKYNYKPRLYVKAENEAKTNKLKLWSGDKLELPCDFRKRKYK